MYTIHDHIGCKILGRTPLKGDIVIIEEYKHDPFDPHYSGPASARPAFVLRRYVATVDYLIENGYRVKYLTDHGDDFPSRHGVFTDADIAVPSLLIKLMLNGTKGITREIIDQSREKYGSI